MIDTARLPRSLADWLVASERELAAAGDAEAEARLEALLSGEPRSLAP